MGFGLAKWVDSIGDDAGLSMIRSARIEANKLRYAKEDLKRDIESVIDIFVESLRVGIGAAKKDAILRGPIKNSIYMEAILREIEDRLLTTSQSAEEKNRFLVLDTAKECITFYGTNKQFTGPLGEVYRVLEEELISQSEDS